MVCVETGVEEVTADYKESKVVVKGKDADPVKVCQRIQKKSGRKVEIISPLPKPPELDKQQQNKEEPQEEKKAEVRFFSHPSHFKLLEMFAPK